MASSLQDLSDHDTQSMWMVHPGLGAEGGPVDVAAVTAVNPATLLGVYGGGWV